MKLLIPLLLIFLASLAIHCTHKQDFSGPFETNGIITGQDFRKCVCCGGWVVKIDSTEYMINSFPDDLEFNLENETLPLPVSLTYETEPCATIQRIKVLSMHKI